MIDSRVRECATERQRVIIDAVNEHVSHSKAAKVVGISSKTGDKRVGDDKRRGVRGKAGRVPRRQYESEGEQGKNRFHENTRAGFDLRRGIQAGAQQSIVAMRRTLYLLPGIRINPLT